MRIFQVHNYFNTYNTNFFRIIKLKFTCQEWSIYAYDPWEKTTTKMKKTSNCGCFTFFFFNKNQHRTIFFLIEEIDGLIQILFKDGERIRQTIQINYNGTVFNFRKNGAFNYYVWLLLTFFTYITLKRRKIV